MVLVVAGLSVLHIGFMVISTGVSAGLMGVLVLSTGLMGVDVVAGLLCFLFVSKILLVCSTGMVAGSNVKEPSYVKSLGSRPCMYDAGAPGGPVFINLVISSDVAGILLIVVRPGVITTVLSSCGLGMVFLITSPAVTIRVPGLSITITIGFISSSCTAISAFECSSGGLTVFVFGAIIFKTLVCVSLNFTPGSGFLLCSPSTS